MPAKDLFRACLRRLGLDVRRFSPASSESAALMAMLSAHRVNLVLDVGANTGQFGKLLRSAGYRNEIVSFEPLTSARRQLLSATRNDPLWKVAEQAAIGDKDGEVELHISGNSVSSSILNMLNAHEDAAPASVYVGKEKVRVLQLDNVAHRYLKNSSVVFIKIDTQGYEDKVLSGASQLLMRTTGLQMELSLVPLYEGQRQYEEMMANLKAKGFELWGMSPAFIDPRSGRLLQVDATFFRAETNL